MTLSAEEVQKAILECARQMAALVNLLATMTDKPAQPAKPYAEMRSINAILDYFDNLRDTPRKREELIEDVIALGAGLRPSAVERKGSRAPAQPKQKVGQSIDKHLISTKNPKGRLKEINGLIGPSKWPDSKWEGINQNQDEDAAS